MSMMRISLNVANLARTSAYYCDALGFTRVETDESDTGLMRQIAGEDLDVDIVRLRLGAQELELVEFDPPGARYPAGSTAADLWFQHFAIVTHDIATAFRRLQEQGSTAVTQAGPQLLPLESGAVTAYKFRDPDGHPLELIQFQPDADDRAWQSAGQSVTLGIDHSAISISNVERSVAFYGLLGLAPQSRHLNTGPEQDRLDGLTQVAVDVIGLSAETRMPPHLELLCYHAPRGRRCDPGRKVSDICDTRLILQVDHLTGLVSKLESSGIQASGLGSSSKPRMVWVRDPDGHALVLLEVEELGDHPAGEPQTA